MQNFFCEPGRIRTCDRLLRREVLYPAELLAHNHGLKFEVFLGVKISETLSS